MRHTRARRPRKLMLVALAVLLGVLAAACGGANATAPTTTSTVPKHVESTATLRARYLQIVGPANKASAKFILAVTSEGPNASKEAIHAIGAPAAAAVQRSGRLLYALRSVSPKQISADLLAVVEADNTVFQGIEDLMMDWGSRGFSPQAWSTAFEEASAAANTAGNNLRSAFGLAPEGASSK